MTYLTYDVQRACVDEVPGKVGSLAVILHQILQKGHDVESFSQQTRLLCKVRGHHSQMVVVGKTVQVDKNFDIVTLLKKVVSEALVDGIVIGDGM